LHPIEDVFNDFKKIIEEWKVKSAAKAIKQDTIERTCEVWAYDDWLGDQMQLRVSKMARKAELYIEHKGRND
ncbi:hypothetical protein H2201_008322, partial [Coniosporium apollinis]